MDALWDWVRYALFFEGIVFLILELVLLSWPNSFAHLGACVFSAEFSTPTLMAVLVPISFLSIVYGSSVFKKEKKEEKNEATAGAILLLLQIKTMIAFCFQFVTLAQWFNATIAGITLSALFYVVLSVIILEWLFWGVLYHLMCIITKRQVKHQ